MAASTKDRPYHISVMVDEVLHFLAPQPDKVYIDATFGGGGHTRAILESNSTCQVIALDWDKIALELNGQPLEQLFPDRLRLVWGNFSHIDRLMKKIGVEKVDGILADFGTSQHQIFSRSGFSFMRDTPLDMRMSSAHHKTTAYDVVNKASVNELITIFRDLGQEYKARTIAQAIVAQRKIKPIKTTRQLALIVENIYGAMAKERRIHPATKVFQALRIYVNKELDNIHSFLLAAIRILKPGGILVCISFHSLEDRLVKQYFSKITRGSNAFAQLLTPHVVKPTESEITKNPASRSACLRAIALENKED